MKVVSKILILVFFFSLLPRAYAEDAKPSSLNLKVGETFYFEGKIAEKEQDSKEESMAEIKSTPFYESTWFLTAASILVVAGASTALYVLTKEPESEGKVITWSTK